MSTSEIEVLSPDPTVQSYIFPNDELQTLEILSQTPEVCTFVAQVNDYYSTSGSTLLQVRLDRRTDRLDRVNHFEKLAALQIQRLIRSNITLGLCKNNNGQTLAYSITMYMHDGVFLNSVWEILNESQRSTVVDTLGCAVSRLHFFGFQDAKVRTGLERFTNQVAGGGDPIPMGNLDLGFHNDFLGLLKSMIKQAGPDWCASATEQPDGSLAIVSVYDDIGEVPLSRQDQDSLRNQLVLCHNNLEPHKIFVRPIDDGSGFVIYDLVAVIDWEMAGIFPFAYEYAYKDAVLGGCNKNLTWYSLFKQKMSAFVPTDASTTRFIEAVRLIHASAARAKDRDVGLRVREKWLNHHLLEEASNVRKGWVLREGENPVAPLSAEEIDDLEAEVSEEMNQA